MSAGYVYVLINEEMPNLVKVGRTSGEPEVRAKQLSSSMGVPKSFLVYKAYAVRDSVEAERIAHSTLAKFFERPNSGREFFSGSPQEVSLILEEVLKDCLLDADDFSVEEFSYFLGRLKLKEFTFACLEFEDVFSRLDVSLDNLKASEVLTTMVGAYVASCMAVNRRPAYEWFFAVSIKGRVVDKAIKFAADFESDPVSSVVEYVRKLDL
jgi:hypothetical protein